MFQSSQFKIFCQMVMSSSNLTVNLFLFLIEDREVVSNTLRKALFGGGHLL